VILVLSRVYARFCWFVCVDVCNELSMAVLRSRFCACACAQAHLTHVVRLEARGHLGVLQQILGVPGILSQILASYRHMHQDAQDVAGIHPRRKHCWWSVPRFDQSKVSHNTSKQRLVAGGWRGSSATRQSGAIVLNSPGRSKHQDIGLGCQDLARMCRKWVWDDALPARPFRGLTSQRHRTIPLDNA
jgi:hypothetical protein